jgi:serine/threonine protein kinase
VTAPGPQIEGFTFVEHLGSGGYSDVYLYERRSPRMRVAVKVLKDGRLGESERKQFAAEAETMAELADHPFIVQVFSADTTPDGRPYLVMKYYPPPNMGVRAARQRYSLDSVLRTGIYISSAVEAAHRAGIVHRDIKPANLLVSQYGEPGLTDFGIAGLAAETDTTDDLGVSIPWTAPEVLSGASNGTIASDVYSLGATLWHLLVGRSPFELPTGDNTARALMGRVLRTGPPSTGRPDVPASMERLLSQTMSKSPAQRPRSALEFARALQTIEQEQRFGRTEIVVEGIGTTGPTPERPATDRGDRTRLHAPTRVSPHADPQPSKTASRSRTRTAPPSSAAPATLTSAGPLPTGSTVFSAPVGSAPVGSAPVKPSGGELRSRAATALPGVAPTVRRPAVAPAEKPVADPPRTQWRPFRLLLIAGCLGAMAIIGVLIALSGGRHGQAASDLPTAQDTEDLSLAPDQLVAPSVVAAYDAGAKILRFQWTIPTSEKDVVFVWRLRSDPDNPTRTAARSYQVKTSSPTTTCLSVQAVPIAGGTASSPSSYVCGKV